MKKITYREYRRDDANSFVRLHDSCFPPMEPAYWHEFCQGGVTAAVADLDGDIIGTVPFQFRELCVQPGAYVPVAWEFSVCVREDLRGTGVGSHLMDTAKELLRSRCAAVAVYRNDEESAPYRFYARNGHQDLMYARPWIYQGDAARLTPSTATTVHPWEGLLAAEEEYLDVFTDAYAAYGGFPRRTPGYYPAAVSTPQYNEVPVNLTVIAQRDDGGRLRGYAVAGEERGGATWHLMEIAARRHDLAAGLDLVSAFCRLASDRGARAIASLADSSPYVPALKALGFWPAARSQSSMVVMAHILDAERLANAVWRESEETAGLAVTAWTPERAVCLHAARRDPATSIQFEMKEPELTRLLFCRLDLRAALADERVTAVGAGTAEVDAIARALPYTPWAYHYLDFV